MGFWSSLGKGLGAGIGIGTGLALTNATFGGFDAVFRRGACFPNGGCFPDYGRYNARQFSRFDAYMQGRYDQAAIDQRSMQLQMAALYYGASPWGC